jgi:hypothetical protein
VNPDVDAAKESLRVVDQLCGRDDYFKEPKDLFQNELQAIRESKPRNPFLSSEEVTKAFEQKIWAGFTNGYIQKLRPHIRNVKKRRFAEEKKEFDRDKVIIERLGLGRDAGFDAVWDALQKNGRLGSYLREVVRRQCGTAPSEETLQAIFDHLHELPSLRSYLLYRVAYFHSVNVQGRRPRKHGNNIDARHIVTGANANILISDDGAMLDLLSSAEGRWPFSAMTPAQFCCQIEN